MSWHRHAEIRCFDLQMSMLAVNLGAYKIAGGRTKGRANIYTVCSTRKKRSIPLLNAAVASGVCTSPSNAAFLIRFIVNEASDHDRAISSETHVLQLANNRWRTMTEVSGQSWRSTSGVGCYSCIWLRRTIIDDRQIAADSTVPVVRRKLLPYSIDHQSCKQQFAPQVRKYGEGGLQDVPFPPAMSPGFLCLTDHQQSNTGRCGTHYQRYHHVVIYTAAPQLQIIVHHFRLLLDDVHDLTTQNSLANIHPSWFLSLDSASH